MLRIQSRENLARQAVLVPYVESLALRLLGSAGSPGVEAIQLESAPAIPAPGWIVFEDSAGTGVAVCPRDVAQGRTSLRKRIEYVRCTARLTTLVASHGNPTAVREIDRETCPAQWNAYRVSVGSDEVWFAVSYPPPVLRSEDTPRKVQTRLVRLRVRGWCAQHGSGLDGVIGECQSIYVQIEDQAGNYQLKASEEGIMIVTKIEGEGMSENGDSLGVRLDLGEIELSLEELVTLRAGSSIELSAEGPLRCFLRVGATTLAAGELTVSGRNVAIRVTEMIHE